MNRNISYSFLLLAIGLFSTLVRADSPPQSDLLEAGKATLVSQIEPGMPAMPIEAWLSSLVGPKASFSWELNDCGEQTGVPEIDAARDMPICSSVTASLPSGRPVYLNFLVGTQSRGAVKSRGLYYAGVLGGKPNLSFRTLGALEAHLREERR